MNKVYMPAKISSDEFCQSCMKFLGRYNFTSGNIKHDIIRNIFFKVPFLKKILSNNDTSYKNDNNGYYW